MKFSVPICLLFACIAGAAVLSSHYESPTKSYASNNHEVPIRKANHIFNAIRGAMRQWDNSWNHNGMSFFIATVPEGNQLYHGTWRTEAVKGMEWLAFEPEHALMFARPRRGPPPGNSPGEHRPADEGEDAEDTMSESYRPHLHDRNRPRNLPDPHQQRFLGAAPPDHPPPEMQPNGSGYLHFYRTSRDLRLIYIDGQSAGKTMKGTLDSQDYILGLNKYNHSNSPVREGERANAFCDIARTMWAGHIDGFLRMESGFEIILCDFETGLAFERAQEVSRSQAERGEIALDRYRLYQAVADRFHGIGGGRVVLDHASLVSAFDWDFEADLFVEDDTFPDQMLPRLNGQKEEELSVLQESVFEMITRAVNGQIEPTIDWQAIIEMFVQRYSGPLKHIADNDLTNTEVKRELISLLQPFISARLSDAEVVAQRCVEQFVPSIWPATFAGRVVHQVASELCGALAKTLEDLEAKHEEIHKEDVSGREAIVDLISYLDWPIWRECAPSCSYDEVCVLPIWPVTHLIADRKVPSCKNVTTFNDDSLRPHRGNESYWWHEGRLHPPQS